MEESILVITAEVHARLSRLMVCEHFGSPPKIFEEMRPKSVLIGKATKEQQAIALLYNQVIATHTRMHKLEGLPFGVNPHVSFDHYRNHVMQPMLLEMLCWSVHRAFPEKELDLYSIGFDAEWNMYAVRGPRPRKKKSVQG